MKTHKLHSCNCGYYTADRSNYNKHIKKCKWMSPTKSIVRQSAKSAKQHSQTHAPKKQSPTQALKSYSPTKSPSAIRKGHAPTESLNRYSQLKLDQQISVQPGSQNASATPEANTPTKAQTATKTQTNEGSTKDRQGFICEICGKPYNSKYGLSLHRKTKHEGKFKHKCLLCNKTFNQTMQYRSHCATHLDVPLSRCEHCNRPFSSHGSLARHLKTCKKSSVPLEQFTCDTCGAYFHRIDGLLAHQQGKHQPHRYTCEGCKKTFAWRSSLKIHKKNCFLLVSHIWE